MLLRRPFRRAVGALCATAFAAPLAAQDVASAADGATVPTLEDPTSLGFDDSVPPIAQVSVDPTADPRDRRVVFTILLGAESRPAYFGSDEQIPQVRFSPNVLSLNFGALSIGDEEDAFDDDPNDRPLGLGFGASFRFINERSSEDYSELDGLDDIDAALEVGALVGYVWENVEAFGQLRYGVIGHETWVGEIGAYYVARPADDFTLRVGPRLLFGTEEYNETYFGITADEAAASEFDEYDPDGGLVSAGVEVIATYRLGEQWWLEGRARWDRLQDDAADSPIVEAGTTDMGTITIGVRRAFVLDF